MFNGCRGSSNVYEKLVNVDGVSTRDAAMPNFVQRTSRLSVRKSTTRELERALGFRLNYCTSLLFSLGFSSSSCSHVFSLEVIIERANKLLRMEATTWSTFLSRVHRGVSESSILLQDTEQLLYIFAGWKNLRLGMLLSLHRI